VFERSEFKVFLDFFPCFFINGKKKTPLVGEQSKSALSQINQRNKTLLGLYTVIRCKTQKKASIMEAFGGR